MLVNRHPYKSSIRALRLHRLARRRCDRRTGYLNFILNYHRRSFPTQLFLAPRASTQVGERSLSSGAGNPYSAIARGTCT